MNVLGAFACLVATIEDCHIPLGFWLTVQFMFLFAETLLMEMRERMGANRYWQVNRRQKKWLTGILVGIKEISEYSWQIYGA